MSVTVQKLINELPPYRDQWIEIHPNQTVKDIIKEVIEAHKEFAPYYDRIALYFDDDNTGRICDNINSFLKTNIRYQEESEESQTSALPTGLLTRGHGDCKHYAGFSAGILDALNRTGRKINWCYVFASYRLLDNTPHHVFVEVNYNGEIFWIDPTPGADKKEPSWIMRKKVNMPLHRNIAGTDEYQHDIFLPSPAVIGGPKWQVRAFPVSRGKEGESGGNPYFNNTPFLGLEFYAEDPYSSTGTDWNITANDINQMIAQGPYPGHTVNGQFVKWIFDKSMKGWNFYYPMGVQDDYVPNLPAWYPHLVINANNELVFDKILKLDDYENDEIHALTAWAQSLINNHSATPYPITPRQVKLYSQGDKDVPRDLFVEDRGEGFLKDAFDFAKKIALVGPRNAYLGLVGINAFGMATKLKNAIYNDDGSIDTDAWTKIMTKWQKFGGDPQKLENTINDGAKKKALLGSTIAGPEVALPAWVTIATTIIAAIQPLVDSILGAKKKQTGIDYTIDPITGQKFPPVPGGGGASDIFNQIKANPLPYVALGAGAFLLLRKKKKVSGIGNLLELALLAYGAWELFIKPNQQPAGLTEDEMRTALIAAKDKVEGWVEYVTALAGNELIKVYNEYFKPTVNDTMGVAAPLDNWTDYTPDGVYKRVHTQLSNGQIRVDVTNLQNGQTSTYYINQLYS